MVLCIVLGSDGNVDKLNKDDGQDIGMYTFVREISHFQSIPRDFKNALLDSMFISSRR